MVHVEHHQAAISPELRAGPEAQWGCLSLVRREPQNAQARRGREGAPLLTGCQTATPRLSLLEDNVRLDTHKAGPAPPRGAPGSRGEGGSRTCPRRVPGCGPAGSTRAAGGGTRRLQQLLLRGVRRAARGTCCSICACSPLGRRAETCA